MTAQAAYKQFLAAPNTSLLSQDATLSYITTTTAFNGATDIIKHYATLRNQVKKKAEKVVDVIEAQNALWIDMATTLEFVTSGGVYLPGLDDNFLGDRTVTLTIAHVVRFDEEGKIKSIRQNWDQACLLKQVEVIGRSGLNWPIRDAQEQIKMITKMDGMATDEHDAIMRQRSTSNNAMRDPHASLSLFENREDLQEELDSVISPKVVSKTRPQQRSFTDILGDEPIDASGVPSGRERSPSKGGAGKNYQANRLFDSENEHVAPDSPEQKSPDRFYRPNPKKYHHFDFADGSESQDAPKPGMSHDDRPKSKHDSSWGFEDFVTPQKNQPGRGRGGGGGRAQDRVHWSTVEGEATETPISKPNLPKPRRDADTHFQFMDDGERVGGDRRPLGRPRGTAHNEGMGLYKNNLYDENDPNPGQAKPTESQAPLGNITNVKDRRKDFDSQFAFDDESPRGAAVQQGKISEDRKKAVKMMDANWDSYDESPKQKENLPLRSRDDTDSNRAPEDGGRVYQVAGNGMGSRKGARGWSIGDSDGEDEPTPKPAPKRQNAQSNQTGGNFWDF